MPGHCKLDPSEQTSVKFKSNKAIFIHEKAFENAACNVRAIYFSDQCVNQLESCSTVYLEGWSRAVWFTGGVNTPAGAPGWQRRLAKKYRTSANTSITGLTESFAAVIQKKCSHKECPLKTRIKWRPFFQHLFTTRCDLNYHIWIILKRKCRHFDEILITGCTGSCHFDNFQCSQWWKFHRNEDISFSVNVHIRHHVC